MRPSPLFLIPLLALAACTQLGPQSPGGNPSSEAMSSSSAPLPESDFDEDGDKTRGTAYVRGYAEIRREPEPFCEQDCAMHDLVVFRVTDTNSEGLKEYLGMMGQTDVSQFAITLGCKEGSIIRYMNQSGLEMKEYKIDISTTKAILSASAQEPVTLFIGKEPIDGGMGAPACYSHFTTVTVVVSDNMEKRPLIGEGCKLGGCSGELCLGEDDENMASNCIFKPEFACYQAAECAKQSDGKCGWTQTPQLAACIQKAGDTSL